MEKTEKMEGCYCPKRPGYSWAHLPPKKEPAEESACSEWGGPACKINEAERGD